MPPLTNPFDVLPGDLFNLLGSQAGELQAHYMAVLLRIYAMAEFNRFGLTREMVIAEIVDYLTGEGVDIVWQEDPEKLYEKDWAGEAHEDLPPLGTDERRAIVLRHCTHLRDQVEKAVREGCVPVVIGGDHSMAAGSIAGFVKAKEAHGRVGVLWIDAHADINTPDSSPSSAYHGMPVTALLGIGDPDFAALGGGPVVLKPENLCYIGIRDLDPPEVKFLNDLEIKRFTMDHIHEIGIERALRDAVAYLRDHTDHIFVTFDLDALEPEYAPATGTPVEGGINKRAFLDVIHALVDEYDFDAIEVTEYNPTLEGREKTIKTIRDVLEAFLVRKDDGEAALFAKAE